MDEADKDDSMDEAHKDDRYGMHTHKSSICVVKCCIRCNAV
jgi:hypothetical protein